MAAAERRPHRAPTDAGEIVSIAYRLCRAPWGHGYASEPAEATLALAFIHVGARRAVATTMAVNHASRNVLERVGYAHTRTVHLDWADPLPGAEQGEVVS
ncbi:GNAT family N-acetyltransferase [Nonomuraea sp. B1E8]|uniref:GNAT family N-acetyltransferase n=1 Tax=unclassified Nonomuraea TaxID=2593643 RepID=UPI00325CC791